MPRDEREETGNPGTVGAEDVPDWGSWGEHVGWLVEMRARGHPTPELADVLDDVSEQQVYRRIRQADPENPYYLVREAVGILTRKPADDRTDDEQAALDRLRAAAELMLDD